MATTNKTPTSNLSPTVKVKEDVFTLKNKLIELERQANEYKTKLDGLRRAKANTVIKLEKEYVNTATTGNNQIEKSKSCEKCDELEIILENQRKTNDQLRNILQEINQKKQAEEKQRQQTTTTTVTNPHQCDSCDHYQQFLDIQKQNNLQLNQQITNQNKQYQHAKNDKLSSEQRLEIFQNEFLKAKHLTEKLQKQNEDYQNALAAMKKEHEDKIADLARREEEANKQVTTWEHMYREWMATMERRVNHLQNN